MPLQVEVAGIKRKLPPSVDIALFRMVQEAVPNVVKHARASKVAIRLHFNKSSVSAIIEDNGVGFDCKEPNSNVRTLGLLGMEERAILLGGTRVALQIPTRPPGKIRVESE